jgi:thiol-disulfide isomerase/thioredoxin
MTENRNKLLLPSLGITIALASFLPLSALVLPESVTANKPAPTANAPTKSALALAKELQGKPVVVDIYATWCGACKNIAPTLSSIKQQYKNKSYPGDRWPLWSRADICSRYLSMC